MAKNYKYSFKLYSSWNYENELEDLNKYSERGWQLVKDGMFHRKFVKNENIRYRYQMDFRRIEDKGRYIETFREQGWEYVDSNFNVCHFFRKIYDPSLPEEEYEIFTDRESLHEMNNRWARIAFVACIFFGIMALLPGIKMIKTPSVFLLLNFITNMVVFIVLLRGFLIMRNPESKKNRRGDSIFITVFLAAVILGASGSIFLTIKRPNFQGEWISESDEVSIDNDQFVDFEVNYPDNYYLDLGIVSKKPITFKVVNENGESVYNITESDFHEDDIRLNLKKGRYYFSMTCETSYHLSCELH